MFHFSTVFELLQAARAAARELGSVQLSQMLLDLQGQLLQLQVQELEKQVDQRALADRVEQLQGRLAIHRKIERSGDAYVLVASRENVRGPYCSKCWDTDETLRLLIEARNGAGYCMTCQSTLDTGDFGDLRPSWGNRQASIT